MDNREIAERARHDRADDRADDRAAWRRYFTGGHWFGYPPPPPPRRPTLGDLLIFALGSVVWFVLALGLVVAIVAGVVQWLS